jgi:exodeoxyribonuclease VII large subunit
MPRTIGVVTSLAAAALRDVLSVMARRAPHVRVILFPAPVQGREAARELCAALDRAAAWGGIDVLLLVRGGGSLEDLWCFNDEALARRIAASPVPVISGVGHETDFTIADFVADLRAPTPTAAAELCCDSRDQALGRLRTVAERLARSQQRLLERAALRLDRAAGQLVSPAQRLQLRRQGLQLAIQRLQAGMQRQLQNRGHGLKVLCGTLHALDPHQVLERGYAIVHRADGSVVKNALDLKIAERLDIEFGLGRAQAKVLRTDALL